ncbi:MAG TPA: hypothetical protein PLG34_08120 [Spirochaetota bacterium]|jgi:nanoRNase/pAp phosphatase (c-di-AMP/oligoRNAs hydrolase)|nr:MAG: hypothetical protein BWX91_01722 [Spirochaetes bacterium ADurb.Bin133]HNZ27899.1 hypothetical protein [Spirochaetota bacterium]HPY87933.1 hypothetical protein [Spirochaetota bacterium]HQB61409.1 hypothetical protein [Spirochaetota bacterium]
MDKKEEISQEVFKKNIALFEEVLNNSSDYLFYFSPDPDAVGISIALALYLRERDKNCVIFLPEGCDPNLDFLFDIAVYNKIIISGDIDYIEEYVSKTCPVLISCDTPTHFLLYEFDKVNSFWKKKEDRKCIEIDHHFGGDSEQIFEESIVFYFNTNSCCEILCEILDYMSKNGKKKQSVDKTFPRNIVLSLLVGICFDTQFGKFVVNKESYDKWFGFLEERLQKLTWSNTKNINNAKLVFDTISRMNEVKEKALLKLLKGVDVINGVGLLIIPPIDKYESIAESKDSTCILSKVILDLSNMVPEYSGAIGILTYYDTVYELYYLKIRRSHSFKKYDLRELEDLFNEVFGVYFLGGGGHEGATSFRIAAIQREDFLKKIRLFHKKFASNVKELTKDAKPTINL